MKQDYLAEDRSNYDVVVAASDREFVLEILDVGKRLAKPAGSDPVFRAGPEWGWLTINEAASDLTSALMWVSERRQQSQVHMALTVVLESARTTAMAIGLLMERGFLADAEARWRGLYELTAQMALIAHRGNEVDADIETLAQAYLVTDGDLQAFTSPDNMPLHNNKDHGWLQVAGGRWRLEKPKARIEQRKVLEEANLSDPPEREHLHHGSVHMSNLVAVAGGVADGQAPAGANEQRSRELAGKVLLALDDLFANAALAVTECRGSDHPEVVRAAFEFHVAAQDRLQAVAP